MRTVIVADGSSMPSHVWDRHFAIVAGQPVLPRTVDQFKEHGEVIVVNGSDDPRYDIPGSTRYFPERNTKKYGAADMYIKCLPLVDGRTNIILGDVRYTDWAVSQIVEHRDKWTHFARSGGSKYTGKPYAEPWGFQLTPEDLPEFTQAANTIASVRLGMYGGRTSAFEFYYTLEHIPWHDATKNPAALKNGPHWFEIDDWTDDFDIPEEVEMYNKAIPVRLR